MSANDMYLDFGGVVKGEAAAGGHEDQIEIDAFSWGVAQSGDLHRGSGGGRGKAEIRDLTVTKSLDASSPDLIKLSLQLKSVPTVTLICRESAGDNKIKYLEFEMKDVIITNVSVDGADGAGKPTESVSLQFAEFKFKYTKQDNKGGTAGTPEVAYDIKKQELV